MHKHADLVRSASLLLLLLQTIQPSFAAAVSIPPSPVPPEKPPEAAQPANSSPSVQAPDAVQPEKTLDQSDDSAPEAPGTNVRQPAQPEGGKDLLQVGAGKPGVPPRFALTLAGGGARGAAHIGVLKELEAAGLKPDFIAGSSVGSMIGALYAGGVPASELEKMALDGRLKKAYFPIPFEFKASVSIPSYIVRRYFLHRKVIPAIYSGKSIARFIQQSLPSSEQRIENLPIRYAAIATNMLDTKPFWITKGDLGTAVQASCTVPGLYKPVKTNQRLLVDGGLRANLPTEIAKAVGAPVVVGVRLHSVLEAQKEERFADVVKYGERISSIFMSEIEGKAMDDADVVISPDVEEISVSGFRSDHIARAIEEGQNAAKKAIPKIRELLRQRAGTASLPGHQ